MKQKAESPRRMRAKLPPLLEIDEEGLPVADFNLEGRRWSSDQDEEGMQIGDWPAELDD